jgi:small RNA 2'-O-methyltransferase
MDEDRTRIHAGGAVVLRIDRKARRRSRRIDEGAWNDCAVLGQSEARTALHDERVDFVTDLLLRDGARTVLDLGCGSGTLLLRLQSHERFSRIVGVDASASALQVAARRLEAAATPQADRLTLQCASFADADHGWIGFDAAVMLETIEHVPPAELSAVEHSVFSILQPAMVVLTTPNHEYNGLFGLDAGAYRHPDHEFEWDRARFQRWARGVASRHGYGVQFDDIGPRHPWLGAPTQTAIFRRPCHGSDSHLLADRE